LAALTTPIDDSPLEVSTKSGNVAQVRRLLDEGADPFEQDCILVGDQWTWP